MRITLPINVPKNAITNNIRGNNGLIHCAPTILLFNASWTIPPTRRRMMNTRKEIIKPTMSHNPVLIKTCHQLGFAGSISMIVAWGVAIRNEKINFILLILAETSLLQLLQTDRRVFWQYYETACDHALSDRLQRRYIISGYRQTDIALDTPRELVHTMDPVR